MSSYASSTASSTDPFSTVPGKLVNSGLSGLVDLGNKYKDNATIGGLVAGKIGDTFSTQANTGLALAYNDAFLGSLGSYQQALENTKKGNAMELMAAEGRIAKDMQSDELATNRYQYDRQLDAQRLSSDATKYGADRQVDATRLTADATKYSYDRQLEGTKYQSDSEERQIGLKGSEERKSMIEKTNQELNLRRDARGAIASAGRRFYG